MGFGKIGHTLWSGVITEIGETEQQESAGAIRIPRSAVRQRGNAPIPANSMTHCRSISGH